MSWYQDILVLRKKEADTKSYRSQKKKIAKSQKPSRQDKVYLLYFNEMFQNMSVATAKRCVV